MGNAGNPARLRAVLDSNVLISSLHFPDGRVSAIWRPFQEGRCVLVLSPAIVSETARKLREKFRWEEMQLQRTLRAIVRRAEIVRPTEFPSVILGDPDDDQIVACALEGRADLIVSGDRHLLALGACEGIPVVRPVDFLRSFGAPALGSGDGGEKS